MYLKDTSPKIAAVLQYLFCNNFDISQITTLYPVF
jgi:hypothetical protein